MVTSRCSISPCTAGNNARVNNLIVVNRVFLFFFFASFFFFFFCWSALFFHRCYVRPRSFTLRFSSTTNAFQTHWDRNWFSRHGTLPSLSNRFCTCQRVYHEDASFFVRSRDRWNVYMKREWFLSRGRDRSLDHANNNWDLLFCIYLHNAYFIIL